MTWPVKKWGFITKKKMPCAPNYGFYTPTIPPWGRNDSFNQVLYPGRFYTEAWFYMPDTPVSRCVDILNWSRCPCCCLWLRHFVAPVLGSQQDSFRRALGTSKQHCPLPSLTLTFTWSFSSSPPSPLLRVPSRPCECLRFHYRVRYDRNSAR